jgi:hypothetical protein
MNHRTKKIILISILLGIVISVSAFLVKPCNIMYPFSPQVTKCDCAGVIVPDISYRSPASDGPFLDYCLGIVVDKTAVDRETLYESK